MKRPLIYAVLGLLSLVLIAGGGAAAWLFTLFPSTDTTIEVSGLEAPVEVLRDDAGVPHIFAKSSRDAYFTLGFVHAQDRMWQMELMRRLGAGRLSEIVGPRTLSYDKWMRTLGLYRLAEQQYQDLSKPVQTALNLYAAGVNARIKHSKRLPWGAAGMEYVFSGFSPEPWRPADSLVWGKIMAGILGRNWGDEILRARLARKLTPTQVGQLWPVYSEDAPITIAKAAALTRSMDLDGILASAPLPAGLPQGASNAWVLGNKNTTTRGAILANDPHLSFSAPILWYLASIKAPDLDVRGATVPGVPFVILGHNANVAWGMTSTQSDTQDLYVEQVDESGKKYMTPDGLKPFETREEIIKVWGAKSVKLTVRETRHGPVISDIHQEVAKAVGDKAVMAMSATFLESGDRTAEAFYNLNRAGNWETFKTALEDFQAPQSNFFFADKKGDIGFIAPGLVPMRKRGWGLVPGPGWDGETDWTGYVPYNQLPSVLNPPLGRIVNTNNKITPDDFPHFLSFDWAPAFRAGRIIEQLDTGAQSVHAAGRLQLDHVSGMAKLLLPLMLDIEPDDDLGRKAITMLGKWNARMSRNRAEPLIFSTWLLELNEALYADELGELYPEYLTLRPRFVVSVLTEHKDWCNNVNTDEPEDCQNRLLYSLKRALDKLKASYGPNMGDWRWGDVHRAQFTNRTLSHLPLLSRFVDLEVSTDGGNYTVNRGASHINDAKQPFAHIHGAGFRAVYDLEDLRRSRFIIATGQSGNPLSPHYKDMLEVWRDGRYRRLSQTASDLKGADADILVLTPVASSR
ncbi:MAG: penicillin acylase family protein [Rhodospirillales bacterium]|nr:penicillin acylase family protein [Rhodospirillales bacterium]